MAKPVYLGVLAARSSSAHRPYQAQTTYFRRLVREAEKLGVIVYIFSPRDVVWRKRRIRGWTWKGGTWKRRSFPFPVAVYDRVSPRGKADLGGVTAVRARFRRRKIPRFNARLGGKWRMHRIFAKNPALRQALPPTRVCNRANVKAMISRYGEVYVKPSKGGQGKGVAWVKRVRGGYVFRLKRARGTRTGRAGSIGSLLRKLGAGRRLSLVQKAIPIPRYKGRSFDIRVLVQRGVDGEWRATGAVVRLGKPHARVTNIHAGGKALPLDEVLPEIGATEEVCERVRRQVSELALEVATAISSSTKGHVAELGVDIALDEEFNCWLLEANSRTGRISFHRAGLTEIGSMADRGPAEYALFLAGKRPEGPQ